MAVTELKKAMDENRVKTYQEMKTKGIPTLYKAVNKPVTSRPDPKTGQGVPWETYSFGIQMAEVAVKMKTGEVSVLKITSVHDLRNSNQSSKCGGSAPWGHCDGPWVCPDGRICIYEDRQLRQV